MIIKIFGIFVLLLTIDGLKICEKYDTDCVCRYRNTVIDCTNAKEVIYEDGVHIMRLNSTKLTLSTASKPTVAYFQNNDIRELKAGEILPGKEKTLEVLDFSYNKIHSIGENAFEKMDNLKVLNLSHNNLKSLKRESFRGGPNWNLKELRLEANPLTTVSQVFNEMPYLETLTLDEVSGVNLREVFSGIPLEHLKYLSLENCNLTYLTDDIFQELTALEYLSLNGNPLNEVPRAVQDIPSLKTLKLSSTSISKIPSDVFVYNHNLIHLYLEENKHLRTISDGAFNGLNSLKTLSLKGCSALNQIRDAALNAEEVKLKTLDVEYANLTTLPSSLNLETIETLNLGGNPWECTCWVYRLNRQRIDYRKGSLFPRCKKPAALDGMMLEYIKFSEACTLSERISSISDKHIALFLFVLLFVIGLYYIIRDNCTRKKYHALRNEHYISPTKV